MSVPFWDPITDGYEGPTYSDNPWDFVMLGGFMSPGVATVTCKPKLKIDQHKPNGGDGAAVIIRGHEPAKVEVQIKVWTPKQWEILQDLISRVWRRPGKASKQDRPGATGGVKPTGAIDIQHPACSLYGVTAVVLESPTSPEPAAEGGAMVLKFSAVQYIPRSGNATRKAQGSGRPPTPLAPEFQRKNVAGLAPSATDGLPKAPSAPASGSS